MQWFVESPLLTLFFCVGAGSLFGRIRFGPVSFGPAGALFVALALSAIEPDVALPPIVTSLSLCVFCYMVGIAAGPAFVSALRTGWQPVVMSLLAVAAMAAAALGAGKAFGFDIGTIAGAFSGAGTATAALGAVQQQLAAGGEVPPQPAIGYAVAYPITVLLTILACSYLISVGKRKPTAEDRETVPPFVVRTLELVGDPALTVHGLSERYEAVVSRLTRNRQTVVAHDAEPLAAGDLLTITARQNVADRLIADLGRPAIEEPWMDRTTIDFRRITLSNSAYVGRQLRDLRMEERFDAVVSRIRRGDIDIIATPDLIMQSGDRLRVTAPRERLAEITTDLGDSERTAGDINAIGLGLGLTLGAHPRVRQDPAARRRHPGAGHCDRAAGGRCDPGRDRAHRTGRLDAARQRRQHAELVLAVGVSGRGRNRRRVRTRQGPIGRRLATRPAGPGNFGRARPGLRSRAAVGVALRHRTGPRRAHRITTQPGALRLCHGQGARPAGWRSATPSFSRCR